MRLKTPAWMSNRHGPGIAEEADLVKLGLGDLRHVRSKEDLIAIAKALNPQDSRWKRQAVLNKVYIRLSEEMMNHKHSETSNNPNLKFVPTEAPIFFQKCSCVWDKSIRAPCVNDSAMLPIRNLEQDAQIQIGDILVLNPFVAEIKTGNFYDYRSGFQLQFMQRLMTLPTEIRHMIYELIVFSWAPDTLYPVNTPAIRDEDFEVVEVARRNKMPCFQPRPVDESFETNDTRRYFELSHFIENKRGLLDYFKASEYMNLEGFLESLRKFEGRIGQFSLLHGAGELRDIRRFEYRQIGVLNDFLDWLWDNIALDLSKCLWEGELWYARKGKMVPKPSSQPCNKSHHLRISHITFTTKTPDEALALPLGLSNIEEFRGIVKLCQYIKFNLLGLRTVLAFFRFSLKQARTLLKSSKIPEWVLAINNNLPVLEKFDYNVLVVNKPTDYSITHPNIPDAVLNNLTDLVAEKLKDILKPKIFKQIDEPTGQL